MKRSRLFKSASLPLAVALAIAGCVPGVLPVQTGLPQGGGPVAQAVAQEVLAAGIVKGRVKAYDFATKKFVPVEGASVVVQGTNFRATTDAQGFYTLTGVAKGEHKLLATKQGLIKAEAPIHVNGVLGIADVDLAMGKPGYAVKQASGLEQATLEVYGVVRDPRGCAVPNANLFVTASSGSIESSVVNDEVTVIGSDGSSEAARVTTTTGFYIFTVTNADDFTRVSISASGRTRGGIPLERARTTSQPVGTYAVDRLDVDAGEGRTVTDQSTGGKEVTGTWSQGFDIQLNKFVGTRNPLPQGTYVTGGHVKIRVLEGLSSRPDEFFVRLRQGNDEYDIVPIAVEEVAGSQIAKYVTFRLPSTLSTRINFNVKIMQLGIEASPQSPWMRATAFTEAEFRLVTATSTIPTLLDDTSTYDSAIYYDGGTGFDSTLGHFIDGEWAEFVFPVQNSHPRLELNMALVFDTPGVSAVEAVLEDDTGATSALSGESISPPVSSVAATRTVTVPFVLPAHVGRSAPRPYNVRVRVKSQVPDGVTAFGLSNVDLRETSLSYSSPQTATQTLGLTQFSATGWTIEKVVVSNEVELRFIPPGGIATTYQASAPLAAFRVIDVTPTDIDGTNIGDPAVVGDVPFNTPEFNAGSQNAVIPSVTDAMRTASFRVVWSGYTYTVNVVFRASDQLEPNTGFTNLDDLQVDIDNALTSTTPPTGAPSLPAGLITVTQPGGAGNGLVFTLGDGGSVIQVLSAGLGLAELGLSPLSSVPTPAATRTEALAWLQNGTATGAPPTGAWQVRPVQEDVIVPGLEFEDPSTFLASSTLPFTVKAGARRGRFDSSGRSVVVFDLVPDASGSIDPLGYVVATYALLAADGSTYGGTLPDPPTAASPSFTEVLKIAYPSTADDPQVLTWKDIPESGTLERTLNDGTNYDI